MTREELDACSVRKLHSIRSDLKKDIAVVRKQLERNILASSLASRRAKRLATDTLLGCRLDQRIEHLFTAIREGKPRVPAEQVVHIIDGIVARTISRRIWIGIVTLLAVVPAVLSLILLGIQNKTMIQKLEAEEAYETRKDRKELITIIQANRIRWVGEGASRRLENFNAYHPRVRSSALTALIALEKQRWSPAERIALPARRMIDLRNGEFFSLVIGGHLSLQEGDVSTDLTRVNFDGGNFTGSSIVNVWLDGSSFRNCIATNASISSPSARNVDFSGMSARGAVLSWDPLTAEPLYVENSNLDNLDLSNGKIEQAMFIRCSMKGANLTGVTYDMANFAHCDFTQTRLGRADFSKNLNALSNCLVTSRQSTEIILPSYCRFEKTSDPAVQKIVMDLNGYQKAYQQ
ncbi:MAG: pentapeptide repeat-containing protein [Akkermansiaceae bacterium]|nr:pentapeptide repeat-containing protein [Akkermansiaceae bacterium]